jgi:hypothetical protein
MDIHITIFMVIELLYFVIFEVFMTVTMKVAVFGEMIPCSPINIYIYIVEECTASIFREEDHSLKCQ